MDEFSTTVNGVVAVDVVHRVDHLGGIDIGKGFSVKRVDWNAYVAIGVLA